MIFSGRCFPVRESKRFRAESADARRIVPCCGRTRRCNSGCVSPVGSTRQSVEQERRFRIGACSRTTLFCHRRSGNRMGTETCAWIDLRVLLMPSVPCKSLYFSSVHAHNPKVGDAPDTLLFNSSDLGRTPLQSRLVCLSGRQDTRGRKESAFAVLSRLLVLRISHILARNLSFSDTINSASY